MQDFFFFTFNERLLIQRLLLTMATVWGHPEFYIPFLFALVSQNPASIHKLTVGIGTKQGHSDLGHHLSDVKPDWSKFLQNTLITSLIPINFSVNKSSLLSLAELFLPSCIFCWEICSLMLKRRGNCEDPKGEKCSAFCASTLPVHHQNKTNEWP